MATVAVRRTTFTGLTDVQRKVLRLALRRLELGSPADYVAGSTRWLVWDDHRLDALHVAILGCLLSRLADIPAGYDPDRKTRAQLEQDVRTWLGANLKRPEDVAHEEGGDFYAEILAANNAPAAIRAASGVPAGLTPFAAGAP